MPSYRFSCPKCNKDVNRVMSSPEGKEIKCRTCQSVMTRSVTGPTSRIVETRDNGIMPRAVEQIADVERIVKERSQLTEDDFRKY